jgi:hypothetical protein
VANEAEAAAYDGDAPIPDSHRAQYKSFTEIELGTLYHITQGKEVADDTLYDFKVIREVDGGERLTTELLPELVSRLAAAADDDLDSWAESWGQTEELQCAADEMLPVLKDLRRLSKLAQAEAKSVYLWNCV